MSLLTAMPTRITTMLRLGAGLVLAASIAFALGGRDAAVAAPHRTSPRAPHTSTPPRATFGIGPVNPLDSRGYFSYQSGPSGTYTDAAAISNYGPRRIRLTVYPADLTNSANGGLVVGLGSQRQRDVGRWLHIAQRYRQVVVPARTRRGPGRSVVPFSFTIPAMVEPGDHGGALVAVLTTFGKNPKGENVRLDQRVAARVYIRVAGPLHPALRIEHLTTTYRGILNPLGHGTATVAYTIHNTGNVRLGATQSVSVAGLFGTGTPTLHPAPVQLLFPGGSQQVVVHVSGVFPTIFETTHVSERPLLFADQSKMTVPATSAASSFIAVPWTLIAVIAGALILSGAYLFARRQRKRHNRSHERVRHRRSEKTPRKAPERFSADAS